MKDMLGNTLEVGQLVLWNQLVAKVKSVHEGLTVVEKGKGQNEPTYVTLEVKVGVQQRQPAPVVRLVDPESEQLVDSLAAGVS